MLGRSTSEKVLTFKDENRKDLKSKEEVVHAFRGKMGRTFKISWEENDNFYHDTGGEVEEWKRRKEHWLREEGDVRVRDTPIITAEGEEIMEGQRERARK